MHLDTNRKPYQKISLCILAAMAVIFAIWTAVSRTNEGVLFHETLLEISEQGDTMIYSGKLYGTPITITCREENGTKYVNFSADGEYYASCRMEYPEGTIKTEFGTTVGRIRIIRNDEVLFSGGYDPDPAVNPHANYFNEDGTWNTDPMFSVQAHSYGDPWFDFEFTMSNIMRFANAPDTSVRGSWGLYFLTLFFTVIGALEIAFPETLFYLSHFMSVRDPEPTDFYYAMHKLGSVILVIGLFVFYMKGVTTLVP